MVRAKKPGQHGGPRQGAPGAQYPNRSDMQQAPRAVPGQEYGQAGAQIASQQAQPLPGGGALAGMASGAPMPGPIDAASARPNEALTAGIPQGAGPGPEALGMPLPVTDPTIHVLQGILSQYPNPDIQALLKQAQAR